MLNCLVCKRLKLWILFLVMVTVCGEGTSVTSPSGRGGETNRDHLIIKGQNNWKNLFEGAISTLICR